MFILGEMNEIPLNLTEYIIKWESVLTLYYDIQNCYGKIKSFYLVFILKQENFCSLCTITT